MSAITKFTVLIVLFASFSFNSCTKEDIVQGNEIVFEDYNLEQAIRTALDKPEGAIYLDDVKDIEELNLVGFNITTLSGIEHFTSLSILDLEGNTISDLTPLANLTSLTFLNLRNNEIADITPLSGLINLTELFLCSNHIDNLSALATLINLEMLTLAANPFNELAPLCDLGTDFSGTIGFHTLQYMLFDEQQTTHLEKCLPNAYLWVSGDVI
ncbi:MAG: leucine-rich repeat domain-containing protein [Chitinophagales bacterium]